MVAEGEEVLDSNDRTLVFRIFLPGQHEQADLGFGHLVALLVVSDDLYGDIFLLGKVVSFKHRTKGAVSEYIDKLVSFVGDIAFAPLEVSDHLY